MKKYIYVAYKVLWPLGTSMIPPIEETLGASTDLGKARDLCTDSSCFIVRIEDGKHYVHGTMWPTEDIEHPFEQFKFPATIDGEDIIFQGVRPQ